MAKALKGCVNEECIAKQKKMYFKDSDTFCPKCGQPLCYVCKRCGMKLPDNTRKYCIRCENEMRDERDEWGKTIINGVSKGMSKAGKALGEGGKQAAGFIGKGSKKVVEAAGNVTVELKDKTANLVEDAKETMENLTFHIPDEYKKVPHLFNKNELPFPMKNVSLYDLKTEKTEASVIIGDRVLEGLIDLDGFRIPKNDQDKINLVALKTGETVKNHFYSYIIKKVLLNKQNTSDNQVAYLLKMLVLFNRKPKYISASFVESGCIEEGKSVLFNIITLKNKPDEEALKSLSLNLYESVYNNTFITDFVSEEYDYQFPDHPLLKCRELIRYIIESN